MKIINKYKILIIGGGRWGLVHLFELVKIKSVIKIYIFSKYNYEYIKKNIFENKMELINKINSKIINNVDFISIVSKNKLQKKYLNNFYNKNKNILVEKPFLMGLEKFNFFQKKTESKNNFLFISIAWFFNIKIKKISQIFQNENIVKVNFYWYEKNQEIKYGLLKNYDKSIYHTVDIFSHILIFLIIFFKKNQKILYDFKIDNFTKKNNTEKTKLSFNDKQIHINSSRESHYTKRYIMIKTQKNKYLIKIKKNNLILLKNSKVYLIAKIDNHDLYNQYKCILNINKKTYRGLLKKYRLIADYNQLFNNYCILNG